MSYASGDFAFMRWSEAGLAAAGLPSIDYPVPLSAFPEALRRGSVPPVQLLAWLQLFTERDLLAWTYLAPAMTSIARHLASAYKGSLGAIEGSSWRLSLQPVDLSGEVVSIQRGDRLVAALADRGDGWVSASHYCALDAKAARYLTGLGGKPGPDGTVCFPPSAFEYAQDCSVGLGNSYASDRGEAYLSYWTHGVGLRNDRTLVPGWIEQRTLTPLPWAELAIELAAQAVLDESSWVDSTRMPAVAPYSHGSPMQTSETLATYSDLFRRDRAIGALVGLAVGDAVGTTTLEFTSREGHPLLTDMVGGGPFRLQRGQWTDDASMALCLAESLLAKNTLDPLDLMQRFVRWRDQGENSCTGSCFDIGGTVSAALSRFEWTGDPLAGSSDPQTAGNGSLMRLSPVAIFWPAEQLAERAAAEQSRTTHAAPAAVDACRAFARLLVRAIAGEPKLRLLMPWPDTTGLDPAVAAVMAGSWKTKSRDQIQSTGYVVHSLEAALWAVDHADRFESAVLTAATLGGDADTVAAITGQLAGALWGCSGIPEKWRTHLAWSGKICNLAAALFEAGSRGGRTTPTSINRTLFDRLCGEGRINIVRARLFDEPPPSHPMPVAADRVRGMLLGLAIGDALGNTSEGLSPEARRHRYGEIRDYLPNLHLEGRRVGLPSDDTQLAFWTLEHLLERGRLDVDDLARRFSERRIFGIGQSVRTFLRNFKAGREWPEAAARSAGNGALMHIAPVLVPHLREATADLWVDTALCAAITHNDPASIAACVAFVGMLWQLLGMRAGPPPEWWVDTYVAYAKPLEGETRYRPRGGSYEGDYEGPIWRFVAERLPQALADRKSAVAAADEWYSGAYLLETVPTALYVLALHADDPGEAIVRAVNDTCDNDTIAAIVGAAIGALHGEAALPKRWRDNLLGRTAEADDGRIFALLSAAEALL